MAVCVVFCFVECIRVHIRTMMTLDTIYLGRLSWYVGPWLIEWAIIIIILFNRLPGQCLVTLWLITASTLLSALTGAIFVYCHDEQCSVHNNCNIYVYRALYIQQKCVSTYTIVQKTGFVLQNIGH